MIERVAVRDELVVMPPMTEVGGILPADILADDHQRSDWLAQTLRQPGSARLALYVPHDWLPTSQQAEYREAYLDAWWGCLADTDCRGDFVDGDNGEDSDLDQAPRVAKAAHLAPILGRAGILSASDVEYITSGTDSDILRASFADTDRPASTAQQATLGDLPQLVASANQAADDPTITEARSRWLRQAGLHTVVRDVARGVGRPTAEQLMYSDNNIERQVALRALALDARAGGDLTATLPWMLRQRQHDDIAVRQQADTALRHLYNSGKLPEFMDMPQLAGELSANLRFMPAELQQARAAAEQISQRPELKEVLYPVVMLGGSRLKGYGDETADIDMALLARPGARLPDGLLATAFTGWQPTIVPSTMAEHGLHVDPLWSNLLFNAVWIGEKTEIDELRQAVATMYHTPLDKHIARRRLEQDVLQYRLLHKGYERHYPVQADNTLIAPDGIDSQSTFWDPGYRRLATRLFAEKVRLPTIAN